MSLTPENIEISKRTIKVIIAQIHEVMADDKLKRIAGLEKLDNIANNLIQLIGEK